MSHIPNSNSADGVLEMGRSARTRKDWPSALSCYRSALQAYPRNAELRWALGSLLREMGNPDDAELEFRRLLHLVPDHVGALVALAEIAHLNADTEAAITYYQAASTARPDDLGIHAALRTLLIERARFDWKDDIAKALGILNRTSAPASDRLAACVLLSQYGVTEGLEREFERLSPQFPQATEWLRVVRQLERSGLARALPRVGADASADSDELILSFGVTEKSVAGSDTLLLVFGGANHRLGLSFDIIQRILRPEGVSILYLRDLERTWYLGGIVGLGSTFAEATAGLRAVAARLKVRRVLAIANCVGCAGAIRYGLALGVTAILGLAPRLRVPEILRNQPKLLTRLGGLGVPDPLLASDVRDYYAVAPRRPQLNLIYGADCSEDAIEALHMSGIEGVNSIGIDHYAGHACLNMLFGRGLLTPLLQGFVRTGAIDSELGSRIRTAGDTTQC